MTAKEISERIITSCKANADLNTFVQSTFNKPLTYARGLNTEYDYYSDNDYRDVPIVIIDPEKKEISSTTNDITNSIVLHIKCVHEGEFKVQQNVVDNVVAITGLDEVETINDHIIKSIQDEFVDIDISSISSYVDPIDVVSNYTEFNGHVVIEFNEEKLIGCMA